MNVLIIGYGSIGKRHFEILSTFINIVLIDIVSKQDIKNIRSFKNISDIDNINIYDYFIISNETSKHYAHLKYICSKVSNKKILVEKPLYEKIYKEFECNNELYVAYNLRFHPVIRKIKSLLYGEQVYYVNIICGQYLPTWRPKQNYRESYSADISQGGGVLRDLSHELDYINWLFGKIDKLDFINTKVSDLEISSDDIFTAIAVTNNKSIINFTMDYISKVPIRKMIVHIKDCTIEADIIKNIITVYNKNSKVDIIEMEQIDKNFTYIKMHKEILNNESEIICSFDEGKEIINFIENIEFKEL